MKISKSILLKILAFAMSICLLALCSCGSNDSTADKDNDSTSSKAATTSDNGEEKYERIKIEHKSAPILRMLVISDVHNKTDRLTKAIASTWSYAQTQQYKGFDAVLIVGDLTDNGTDEELGSIMSAYKNAVAATGQSIPLISCMGNHEFGNKVHSDEENAQYIARFEKHVGHKATQEFDIKGIKFLALSPDNHAGNYTTATNFAMNALKGYDKEKPVFVLQHYPFANTVFGSEGTDKGSLLREAIGKYTNVIDLSGHSHAPITNLRTLYQQKGGFTGYNCGSFTNSLGTTNDIGGSGYYQSEQFSIFEVYDDNITDVKLYDMGTDKILDTQYQLGAKVNNTLDYLKKATQKPVFKADDKVTITSVGTTAVEVSFPQATDDDKIEKYRVDVLDASGKSVANSQITSYYFKVDAPDTLSQAVIGLKEKTEYTATVTAVDFYGNESEPLKSGKFTTTSYPQGLTALISGKMAANSSKWEGAVANISDKGYFISSQGTGHYLKLKEAPNLKDTWMASVDYYRATYNLTDEFSSCSAMQIGPLSLGVKRGSDADYLCLSYNYNGTAQSPSVFADGLVLAKAKLTSMLGATNRLAMTYEKGEVKIYRDGALAIHLTAAELKSKVGGSLPNFDNSQIVLRLNDTWVVDKAGATFENFELKN